MGAGTRFDSDVAPEGTDLLDPRNPVPASDVRRPAMLPALTSVRFFAALHVVLYHLFIHHARSGPLWSFLGAGYQGVSFFFVLSGFILAYSHAREYEEGRGSATRFYFARFARIYPVYLLSMLFAACISWQELRVPLHAFVFLLDLGMLQAWSIRTVLFFNIPAWTLCCEAFFYLLFPVLVLRLRPRSGRHAIAAITFWWLLAMAAPVLSLWQQFGPHWRLWIPEQPGAVAFALRRNPLFTLPEFFAGVVTGWVHLHLRLREKHSLWLAAVGIGSLLVALPFADHLPDTLLHNGLLIPAYVCAILGLSGNNVISRILSAAPLLLLGEASYALYLFHFQVNDWLNRHLQSAETFAAAGWKLLLFLPLSITLHLLVERPCRRWLLRWWKARHLRADRAMASHRPGRPEQV